MLKTNYQHSDLLNHARNLIMDSIAVKQMVCDSEQLNNLVIMANNIAESIQSGGKLMLCGNGGSAADAQHLAAELLVRLRPQINRNGIASLSLATDSSSFTACGNDYGFEYIFERMVQSIGKSGDILLGISTSGNSENVIRALIAAKEMKITAYGFLGAGGGRAKKECDCAFLVPSDVTGRIQEVHITAGHALMEMVENLLLTCGYINLNKSA